jgi:2-oxoglutarate dehydrogenase E1 component
MHIQDSERCDWIRENIEQVIFDKQTEDQKVHMYTRLNWAHQWGAFLSQKFNTMKRFGLEGCESFVPGLKYLIDSATE